MRAQRGLSILSSGVLAFMLAIGALAVQAPPALGAASDQLRDTSVSTYELQPARGVVHAFRLGPGRWARAWLRPRA